MNECIDYIMLKSVFIPKFRIVKFVNIKNI